MFRLAPRRASCERNPKQGVEGVNDVVEGGRFRNDDSVWEFMAKVRIAAVENKRNSALLEALTHGATVVCREPVVENCGR